MEKKECVEDDFDEINDTIPLIHNSSTCIKKKSLSYKKNNFTEIPHETKLNNKKKEKYFSNINDEENSIKIALEKYENSQKLNYNDLNDKNDLKENNNSRRKGSFQLNKEILKFAEPRSTVKQSFKIQPKNFENINESESEEEEMSENCVIYTIKTNTKSKNDTQITQTTNQSFSNESSNSNLLNIFNLEEFDFIIDCNLLNFENLVLIDNLYMDLRKDLEMNKMEIIQNKLAILKDFFDIINDKSNIDLFLVFEKYSEQNNTIQKCIKEFILQKIIYFFILNIIILIENEKEIYLSGIKNLAFYYSQNFMSFILICLNKSNLTKEKKEENTYIKLIKKLEENKTWLNNLNCKKIISNNNKIAKQILKNILNTIKEYFQNNNEFKEKYPFIESNINLLNAYIKSIKKSKINETINEILQNKSIKDLLQKTVNKNPIEKISNLNEENIEEEKPKIPYLNPINEKYKYTLVLDLDETLVHYVEDEESAYIQIRPGTEDFIIDLSNYFEIIIFTAALKNYADIVIDSIDPNNKIMGRLYRNHTNKVGDINFKDLSKLGRDLKNVIIIDNNSCNFGLQPKNGLLIRDFEGDENDDELDYLKDDLIKLVNSNPDDVTNYLPNIQNDMNKRYQGKINCNSDNKID